MAALDMDFSARRRLSPWTALVLALGLIATVQALLQRDDILGALAQGQARQHRLEHALSRQQGRSAVAPDPRADAEAAVVATALQRPWEAMLDSLQAAARDDVLITRLAPQSEAGRLQVTGQADSSAAFLDYVARLRRDTRWRDVQPVSEETVPLATGVSKPLAFQLLAEWGAK